MTTNQFLLLVCTFAVLFQPHFVFSYAISAISSTTVSNVQCPFDDNANNCDCRGLDPSNPNVYDVIECTPTQGHFHPIEYSSKLTVKQEFSILTKDTSNITMPADAFIAFDSINRISFVNVQYTTIVSISLDSQAFYGVNVVNELMFSGFRNLLPLPQAVINVGRKDHGLIRLRITNGGPVRIPANQFDGFNFLDTLSIVNTHIESIDDQAFTYLNSTLELLTFSETWLSAFPLTALSPLKKLGSLDMTGNNLSKWPKSAFANFPVLYTLVLSQNYLQEAIDIGTFDNFPRNVSTLDLSRTNLHQIPTDLLKNEFSRVIYLSLAGNRIAHVQAGDFPQSGALSLLDLSDNPLLDMDEEAFQSLPSLSVVSLAQGILSSFDLSSLNGLDKLEVVTLDFQRKNYFELKVSDASKVPQNLKYISLESTDVLTLNSDLEPVISRVGFAGLSLDRVHDFTCDHNTNWMAKYIVCPDVRIVVTGTACANLPGTSVRSYMLQLHPVC